MKLQVHWFHLGQSTVFGKKMLSALLCNLRTVCPRQDSNNSCQSCYGSFKSIHRQYKKSRRTEFSSYVR